MARFTRNEPVIAALATDITNGLTTYADEFPSPPVSAEELKQALEAPGEPGTLEVFGMGEGSVLLDWKEPNGGGMHSTKRRLLWRSALKEHLRYSLTELWIFRIFCIRHNDYPRLTELFRLADSIEGPK